ncbi:MAG: hypothetical protein IT198_10825 [Acidimicrobiia bacterium]|nr:hypothetical protein [Acidimicrobiia bacterium]
MALLTLAPMPLVVADDTTTISFDRLGPVQHQIWPAEAIVRDESVTMTPQTLYDAVVAARPDENRVTLRFFSGDVSITFEPGTVETVHGGGLSWTSYTREGIEGVRVTMIASQEAALVEVAFPDRRSIRVDGRGGPFAMIVTEMDWRGLPQPPDGVVDVTDDTTIANVETPVTETAAPPDPAVAEPSVTG